MSKAAAWPMVSVPPVFIVKLAPVPVKETTPVAGGVTVDGVVLLIVGWNVPVPIVTAEVVVGTPPVQLPAVPQAVEALPFQVTGSA
jgi:hypothetical protein